MVMKKDHDKMTMKDKRSIALTPYLRPLIGQFKVESATPFSVGQRPPSRPAAVASLSTIVSCSFHEYIGRSSLVQRAVLPFVVIVLKVSIEPLLQCTAAGSSSLHGA